jgi:ArsR family transcriptional regulator
MKEFIRVMKAMSDPTRVKMLKILEKRSMCVCELQTALGIAQSTTSKHLKFWKTPDW